MIDYGTKRVGYTISEVARMIRRNRTTIHRWLERGVLRAIQVPGGKRLGAGGVA